MKLTYRRAILSFCADLTDPHALNLTIGVLLIGDSDVDNERVAAAVILQPSFLDPFASEHVSDALMIVKEHIASVAQKPHVTTEDILHALYTMLRNSLFVSSISDERVVEVAASEGLYDTAVGEIAMSELKVELATVAEAIKRAEVIEGKRPAVLSQSGPTGVAKAKRVRSVRSQQSEVWTLQA